ncbi:MAG TPA: hypothetical protein VGD98_13370 [Ktedonobacteraceae bacterium]
MSGSSAGGNDESGYYVTDPNGHITPVGSQGAAENYAHEQNKLLLQRDLSGTGPAVARHGFRNLIGGCLLAIVIIFVAAAIIGWVIATFVVK